MRTTHNLIRNFSGHESLDMKGLRIQLDGPLDLAEITGVTAYANRRALRNGQLEAVASSNWDTDETTSSATYSTGNPYELTGVANIETIQIGALVTGNGVGREVYVKAKDELTGTLTLSQKLINPASTQTYTFSRFKYILDCSGFSDLSRFQVEDVEFLSFFHASGILLPKYGASWNITNCWFTRPKDRAITSFDRGCFGIHIDRCNFLSPEYETLAQDRTSIAITLNSNDVKILDNHAVRFKHFIVMSSGLAIITGNHFWQGDPAPVRNLTAGIVLTDRRANCTITANYVDNCFIEISNEHANLEDGNASSPTFGDLVITSNIFVASDVPTWFTFLRISPYGDNHRMSGMNVAHNTFNLLSGSVIDRVESLNLSNGSIDHSATEDMVFQHNIYNGVTLRTENPAFVEIEETVANIAWTFVHDQKIPFNGRVLSASGLTHLGPIQTSTNVNQYYPPYLDLGQGPNGQQITINWNGARKGKVGVELRCDKPG